MKILWKGLSIIAVTGVLVWYMLFLSQKIDLTTADLGRHIQNGAQVVAGHWSVVYTNFYSYSNPDFGFINHHWGSGVVFYFLHNWFGFTGLSIFYLLLGAATLWWFFDVARKESNWYIAAAVTALVLPLAASRAEVRPEMFTYFFSGMFLWILMRYEANTRARCSAVVLPVTMLFWVNLHVGFFFGFIVMGVFLCEKIVRYFTRKQERAGLRKDILSLLIIFALCLVVAFLNPNGWRGAVYPLNIFRNYAYLIVENQSVRFLENLNHTAGLHFLMFKIVAGIALAGFIAVAIKQREIPLKYFLFAAGTAGMAYFGIRNFPFFGLFIIPALAYLANQLLPKPTTLFVTACLAAACGLAVFAAGYRDYLEISSRPYMGLGLMPQVNASADFFNRHDLHGPVFNNYDIGGYLIYHLYPKEQVFVDNRPEAYPSSFFQDTYIPMQQDEKKWKEQDNRNHFNAIFFSYRDFTPWAQQFLIARVRDPDWAPVFADAYNIIFLKRNALNAPLVRQYELPKSMFGVAQ